MRNPDAQELKRQRGTERPDRSSNHNPTIKNLSSTPNSPVTLKAEEKKVWKHIVGELVKMGFLEEIDLHLVCAYCREIALYHKSMKTVAKEGAVVTMQNGKQEINIISPHYKVAGDSLKRARMLAAKFGLTPADRNKLHIEVAGENVADYDEFSDI